MISSCQHEHSVANDDRYRQAVSLFNTSEWYAAHDVFEELWHESLGDERVILQGIIQIAVAEYHLCNGNIKGSILLMAEGLNRLQTSPPLTLCLDTQMLTSIVSQRLAVLQSGQTLENLPLPVLKSMVTNQD